MSELVRKGKEQILLVILFQEKGFSRDFHLRGHDKGMTFSFRGNQIECRNIPFIKERKKCQRNRGHMRSSITFVRITFFAGVLQC